MNAHLANQRNALVWPTMICGLFGSLILAFAIIAGPANAATPAAKPSEFELSNGLKVVVVPDHRVPIVTHMVFYRIGSVDEAPGEEGLAHYLEHMMFMGTPAFPKANSTASS